MQIIKVKFINNGFATGRPYTYFSEDSVSIGDAVQINPQSRGIVTGVDVTEEEIKDYRDKVKVICGKIPAKKEPAPTEENGGNE